MSDGQYETRGGGARRADDAPPGPPYGAAPPGAQRGSPDPRGAACGGDRLRRAPSAAPSDHSGSGNFGENFELDDFLERDEAYRQIMTLSGVGAESPLDDGAGDRMWSDDVFGSLSAPHFRRSAADSVVGNGVDRAAARRSASKMRGWDSVAQATTARAAAGSEAASPSPTVARHATRAAKRHWHESSRPSRLESWTRTMTTSSSATRRDVETAASPQKTQVIRCVASTRTSSTRRLFFLSVTVSHMVVTTPQTFAVVWGSSQTRSRGDGMVCFALPLLDRGRRRRRRGQRLSGFSTQAPRRRRSRPRPPPPSLTLRPFAPRGLGEAGAARERARRVLGELLNLELGVRAARSSARRRARARARRSGP